MNYSPSFKRDLIKRLQDGLITRQEAATEAKVCYRTILRWEESVGKSDIKKLKIYHHNPKILLFDCEVLPNEGYFYDVYNDKRSIPLSFIKRQKAILCISYKWLGEENPKNIMAKTPYKDDDVLKKFMPLVEQANYIVAHNLIGFDEPIVASRLFANKMPCMPPVCPLDTLVMARGRFRRHLNSNSLDHLSKVLGLESKLHMDAGMWVKAIMGDKDAIKYVGEYCNHDVNLLERVFVELITHSKRPKLNLNLLVDDKVDRCNICFGENLEHRGFEYTPSSFRHRLKCNSCGAYTTRPKKAIGRL
jgi:DNA polymerase III epsilon subunit-like protein